MDNFSAFEYIFQPGGIQIQFLDYKLVSTASPKPQHTLLHLIQERVGTAYPFVTGTSIGFIGTGDRWRRFESSRSEYGVQWPPLQLDCLLPRKRVAASFAELCGTSTLTTVKHRNLDSSFKFCMVLPVSRARRLLHCFDLPLVVSAPHQHASSDFIATPVLHYRLS